ncbi:RidA family protein [Xenorhabdus bovienii]|nr:RidA family protein [Xenorhabdus bovienii]
MKKYASSIPFPFSRAVEANGFLFLSGQLSMNDKREPVQGSVEEQTHLVLQHVDAALKTCGSSFDKIRPGCPKWVISRRLITHIVLIFLTDFRRVQPS